MRALTDSGPTEAHSKKPDYIQNLFDLMKLVSTKETIKHFDDAWKDCTIRYGDLKKQLGEDTVTFLTPVREKIEEISANETYLRQVARHGAAKARESAQKTIKEVRSLIGIRPF
jgi:tryptophanyl-tRNA synthetase